MGDPARNAGGTPDDWAGGGGGDGGSKKSACDGIFGLMLLIGLVQVAQLFGYLYLAAQVIT